MLLDNFDQPLGRPPDVEVPGKAFPCPFSQLRVGGCVKRQPALQAAFSSVCGVFVDEASLVQLNFTPDVDLVADQHRLAASQCLGHHNAKVFLVGRQAEHLGSVKSPPFFIALQHAGPTDAVGNAEIFCLRFLAGGPTRLVGASHDQVQALVLVSHPGKSLEQQVAALFFMNAA